MVASAVVGSVEEELVDTEIVVVDGAGAVDGHVEAARAAVGETRTSADPVALEAHVGLGLVVAGDGNHGA